MAKRPTDEGSDSMRMFGSTTKAFRIRAGLTHDQVAEAVGYSKSLVVCVERGTRMPSPAMVEKLDEVCQANGVLIEAAKHLSRQRYPSWFEEYAAEEAKALTVLVYDTHLLKGLLQTEEYAREVFVSRYPALEEDSIENRVAARLERQGLFTRKKPQCRLSFVIEESVLRRPMSDNPAMVRQLEHLLEVCQPRNVTIQVMPLSYGLHAGMTGAMTLLETPEHKWLGYLESRGHGQLIDGPDAVSDMQEGFNMLRSQALNPSESVKFIKKLAGEL